MSGKLKFCFPPQGVDYGVNWLTRLAVDLAKQGHLVIFCNSTQLPAPQPVKQPFYPDERLRFQLDNCWVQRERWLTETDPDKTGIGGAKFEDTICMHISSKPPNYQSGKWLSSVRVDENDTTKSVLGAFMRKKDGFWKNAWFRIRLNFAIIHLKTRLKMPPLVNSFICDGMDKHVALCKLDQDGDKIERIFCGFCGKSFVTDEVPSDQRFEVVTVAE